MGQASGHEDRVAGKGSRSTWRAVGKRDRQDSFARSGSQAEEEGSKRLGAGSRSQDEDSLAEARDDSEAKEERIEEAGEGHVDRKEVASALPSRPSIPALRVEPSSVVPFPPAQATLLAQPALRRS